MKPSPSLDPAAVAAMVTELGRSEVEHSPTELVELIGQLELLKNSAAALQARASVALRWHREAEAEVHGHNARRVPASVAGEVALARRESPHHATRLVGLAMMLASELPHTMRLFRAGLVSEWRAGLVARETACLSREHRAMVDEQLAGRLAELSDRQVASEARRVGYRLDPHSIVERIGQAEADRRVSLRPAPDCMARLSALLPVAQGVAVLAALGVEADTARAAGDARSRGQVMADTLVARTTGLTAADEVGVEVQLVMTDSALLGGSHEPARLAGYGPLPAGVARRIAAAASGRGRAWLRRLYNRPGTGELVAMESRRRIFPAGLKAFIATRDEVCRTPWCGAPIRHTDHVVPAHAGGTTTADNGQGLCEQCNQLKEHPGWRARPGPGGSVALRSPSGHEYASMPPPLPHEPIDRPYALPFPVEIMIAA